MIKINLKKESVKYKRGFSLLFSVLVSSLILAVGASIISIALKQVILAGTSRDSSYAFYAANTGIECAMYWDINAGGTGSVFATSSSGLPNNAELAQCVNGPILYEDLKDCGDINNTGDYCISGDTSNATTTFRINPIGDLPYCVDVSVSKNFDSGTQKTVTVVEARGYNTCDADNPRRIERGLRIRY